MNHKDYFVLGCKLFGIWCFVWFLYYFLKVFPDYFLSLDVPDDVAPVLRISRLFGLLKPFILLALGVYLVSSGRFVHNLAYPTGAQQDLRNLRETFVLGLKLLGMYSIVSYIPQFLDVLSTFVIYSNSPKYMNTEHMREYVFVKALPTIAAIVLGLYLVKSGQVFIRIGFAKAREGKSENRDDDTA